MDMNNNMINAQQKENKGYGVLIGLIGSIITILSLFLPYAKSGKESKSLFGLAKLYIDSDSASWGDKDYETFYKVFVPVMLGLIVLFAVIYLFKCMKKKPVGMVVANILTIVAYEVLKWDFADRRVVPGACDKGIAFTVIYIAFAMMIAGFVLTVAEKKK